MLVTGRLAEPAARRAAQELEASGPYRVTVEVLGIDVAALMTSRWVARKLRRPDAGESVDRVLLPGYCRGDLGEVAEAIGAPVELGPPRVQDLPAWMLGGRSASSYDGSHALEILAEINHAPRLERETIARMAEAMAAAGADVIDIGCDPQAGRDPWRGVSDVVAMLRDLGLRVSIDSFHPAEVQAAVDAGAELVLSVNGGNVDRAVDWGVEVVVIPDRPDQPESVEPVMDRLSAAGAPFRVDPILEPIGLGFAASLGRYLGFRQRHPDTPMMMGVGNLTEMTEVDSAGVNALLAGVCAELEVGSVLTTQVINWARTSVAELDVARRLMHHAIRHQTPPKHVDDRLVMLRDPGVSEADPAELQRIAEGLRDDNVRLFVSGGRIHAMRRGVRASGDDPFVVFDQLGIDEPDHAFYLGYEMAKAVTAMTLGKVYEQDEPLRWGMLSRDEVSHYERRTRRRREAGRGDGAGDG